MDHANFAFITSIIETQGEKDCIVARSVSLLQLSKYISI